jgi:hypothetical protein
LVEPETMSFRRLSHRFTVRCDDPTAAQYVSRVLGRFAADGGPRGTSYEVADRGSSGQGSRYVLMMDGEWRFGSEDQARVLDDLFARVNLSAMEATPNLVLVHSGAVVAPRGAGVLLPAASGSGKTTLVAGLVRAGFGYLSDEAAVLDPVTGLVDPYAVHLSLKGASRDRFPEAKPDEADLTFSGSTWHVDPEAIRPRVVGTSCEVGFVIAHRYESGAAIRIEPLTPAQACIELVQNLMLARRDTPRSLDLLARICRASRSYRLTHGDLDAAVEAIEELTA